MRNLTSLTCVSLMALLGACATPNDGYYDANGNFIPNHPNFHNDYNHSPLPAGDTHQAYVEEHPGYSTTTTTIYTYDRGAGYYDYNGYYVANGPVVDNSYLPPRGMCRVWFPERPASSQPAIESCSAIRSRVPAGAYIIYGG